MNRHVAHINWATMRGDFHDPVMAEFAGAVARVNAIAERSPGFVWRHGDETTGGIASGWPMFCQEPRIIASFSVWETPETFGQFVEKTVHGAFVRRGADWFLPGQGLRHVMWWVTPGHIPDMIEARKAVDHLVAHGPDDQVFTLSSVPSPRT